MASRPLSQPPVDNDLFLSPELFPKPQTQPELSPPQLLGQPETKRRRVEDQQQFVEGEVPNSTVAAVYSCTEGVSLWVTASATRTEAEVSTVDLPQPCGQALHIEIGASPALRGWSTITASLKWAGSDSVDVSVIQAVVCVPSFPAVLMSLPADGGRTAVHVTTGRPVAKPAASALVSALLVAKSNGSDGQPDEDVGDTYNTVAGSDLVAHCSAVMNINASALFGAISLPVHHGFGLGRKAWSYRCP